MNPLLLLPESISTPADSAVLCPLILTSPPVFLGVDQQRNEQHLRAPLVRRGNVLFPHHMQKLRKGTYHTMLFITCDVVKLSQIIIISDRFDISFDIKTQVLFVSRRFEMTNEPTVSSRSCLSTLIYLLISTVSEPKTRERYLCG